MKQLVCIAETIWRKYPGRSQEIMSRLSQMNCLFFEPPVTWLAYFLGKVGRQRLKAHKLPGRQRTPTLTVYALPPILPFGARFSLIDKRNKRKLARYIEKKMEQHDIQDPILWIATEAGADLPRLLSVRDVIYDCTTPVPGFRLTRAELSLLQDADLVFAPTVEIVQQISFLHSNAALLPNGISYSLFAPEFYQTAPNATLELRVSLGHPLLGCSEPIRQDTELVPVVYAARTHPEWSFLFLGSLTEKAERIFQKLPNVRCIHPSSHVEMSAYVRQFDLCISLQTALLSPLDVLSQRMLEYLSTGRPIVACLYPDEIEFFPDVVYSAYHPREFVELCAHALEEQREWFGRRRQSYGQSADWALRVAEITRLMEINGILKTDLDPNSLL